jgi:hypothetical protein
VHRRVNTLCEITLDFIITTINQTGTRIMSSDIEQITLIKSQTLARMAEITAEPKPTYQIDGQMVVWGDYLNRLQKTVDWCDAQLAAHTPVEVRSQGYT